MRFITIERTGESRDGEKEHRQPQLWSKSYHVASQTVTTKSIGWMIMMTDERRKVFFSVRLN